MDLAVAVLRRPAQRGEQAVVLGDVVGGDAEAAVQFVEDGAVGILDEDTVAGGAGVSPCAAVDIRSDHADAADDQDAWVAAFCGRK